MAGVDANIGCAVAHASNDLCAWPLLQIDFHLGYSVFEGTQAIWKIFDSCRCVGLDTNVAFNATAELTEIRM
ncbi:hypothetical protein D3C85_1276610 [compost metagenome]